MRIDRQTGKKHVSSSSKVEKVSDAKASVQESEKKKKANNSNLTAVPVGILPDGTYLLDSWEVAAYSGLPPIDNDLKTLLDNDLGPLTRQLAYSYLFKPANDKVIDNLFTSQSGYMWKFLWWLFVGKSHDL